MFIKSHDWGKSRCTMFRIYTEILQLNKEKIKQLCLHIQLDAFHFETKSISAQNCLDLLWTQFVFPTPRILPILNLSSKYKMENVIAQ